MQDCAYTPEEDDSEAVTSGCHGELDAPPPNLSCDLPGLSCSASSN